jgi:hypothetical protein
MLALDSERAAEPWPPINWPPSKRPPSGEKAKASVEFFNIFAFLGGRV